ncbi:MAG: toll/interleukin-1 receptor domain-containing protein [bacterium]
MENAKRETLAAMFFRILEVEPSLRIKEGIENVIRSIPETHRDERDAKSVRSFLSGIGNNFRRRAVLNPVWLGAEPNGIHFHFYLVNAQAGWLRRLLEQTKLVGKGISHFVLYGIWDSLIILSGDKSEADELMKKIQGTTYHDLTPFSAVSVPLFHRYKKRMLEERLDSYGPQVINALVDDYDREEFQSQKEELENKGIILGPIWVSDSLPISRVTAYVGINLRAGSHALSGSEVMENLFGNDILRTCIVNLFEIERGYPFHYFVKLVCNDLDELDQATDAISFARIGRVGLDGNTFVVASGKDELPVYNLGREIGIIPSVDLGYFEDLATREVSELGTSAVTAFNRMEGATQLIVLRSLSELRIRQEYGPWDNEREDCIRTAILAFARACIEHGPKVSISHMTGPVSQIATSVEGFLKRAFRLTAEAVYGRDYSKAQKELQLPTKDFRKLSLGKVAEALSRVKKHKDFGFLWVTLDDDWLDRLKNFADLRNVWVHNGIPNTYTSERVIDEARRILVEGIDLLRWIAEIIQALKYDPPSGERQSVLNDLPEKPQGRPSGIFISYSSKNKDIAERIANGLNALNYVVWYDAWAIGPGDSIIQKINEGLAENDILLILLSPDSVSSEWVKRELDTALTHQLSGQNVTVIPILIEKCAIPATLTAIRYIEMTEDFQKGFVELLGSLARK